MSSELPEHPETRSRRLQFSLRSLLLGITVLAVLLAYYGYHRLLTVTVTYRFSVVDASAVKSIYSKHSPNPVQNSCYEWVVVDDQELGELLHIGGAPAPILAENSRVVSSWLKMADAYTYIQPRPILIARNQIHTVWESGEFGGFLGVRRFGQRPEIRIQYESSFHHPNYRAILEFFKSPSAESSQRQRYDLQGRVNYEGFMPEGHLVFLAPNGDETYHAIIFDAR